MLFSSCSMAKQPKVLPSTAELKTLLVANFSYKMPGEAILAQT
jgi:hypothetical protein